MISKLYGRFFAAVLILSLFTISLPSIGYAQTAAVQTQVAGDWQKSLQTIEEKVEKRRAELGIPGMSLVIVKDGEIIFMKGFGYKDYEKKIAVTPDTQFAIGSATKAFTALAVLMAQDAGKLSLDDNPKKYLPYFKINDAEIDKNITIRDLMAHSSGLNRTDLGWITGKLNREEIVKVAGEAKPTAKLREKFQYQNVMFVAAGEIVNAVEKKPFDKFVPERIFKPLGMTNSTMSINEMKRAKDFSNGYEYNFDTKETRNLPIRDIDAVAAAGSINSSGRDMANWLKFIVNGGVVNGKRLVSEKGYEEWTKPQMKIAGKSSYGLGWFLQDWNGLKVVQHGGNIDGFNSMVATIPEKKLGFVMLTNVSGSPLGNELMPIVWENILGEKKTDESVKPSPAAMEKLVGKYRFEAAKMDIEVKVENGNLVMVVPGQPTYTLQRTGDRQYKLVGAPDGFAAKFTPAQGNATEMYLQQPQGNYTLPRVNADGTIAKIETGGTNPAKELVGKYNTPDGKGTVEVRDSDGKITFNIGDQQPYTLTEKSKDSFNLTPLPDSYWMKVKRDAAGKVESVTVVQPEGEFEFKRAESKTEAAPKITVDELMTKTIAALGGEANWRKLTSRETKFEIDFENQGVKGFGTEREKSPNLSAVETTLTALGKPIGTAFEFFDGASGGEVVSFAPTETYTGQRLEDVKYDNNFYGLLDWKNNLKSSEIRDTEKVGDEDAYVVVLRPEKASEYTYYISQKTFLPLKKAFVIVSSTSSQKTPQTSVFSDYRAIDGVMLPFKTVSGSSSMGNVVTYLKEVRHNVTIDDKVFKLQNK
jgi:CubicO group peptidase (beta-lactamase class C family)